jgi:hypothetical protein
MLRDRRVLVERDLKLAKEKAAKYYLMIVISGDNSLNEQYRSLRTNAENLQFDLDMINELISQGHQ